MSYWDTSAVIKLFLDEPDSEKYRAFAAAVPRITVLVVAAVQSECGAPSEGA